MGAQLTACGDRGGDVGSRLAKRALLEQSLAESAAKNSDGDRWFDKGEKKKKARHQDTQERMDSLMDGMVGEGSLMREAIRGLQPHNGEGKGVGDDQQEHEQAS